MEDLIIYIEYQDIKEKESNKITEEEFFKLWLKEWTKLDLFNDQNWDECVKSIIEALVKTGWLKVWSELNFYWNEIWAEW
jgi:hypothetical protein